MLDARVESSAAAWPVLRAAGAGVLAAFATVVIMGVPTDVVPNPWFHREVPVRPFDVAVLVALSVLAGALAVTYAGPAGPGGSVRRTGIGSGIVGWFAISCPACNKLVVVLAGASGATGWFASLQPVLGASAVALAVAALAARVRAIRRRSCYRRM
jgi:hypothetical protein